jgi:hypothetical protein
MAILKRDLQAVQRDIKALEKRMERLLKAFDKERKAKNAARPKKATRSAKSKKSVSAARPALKTKDKKVTATEQILKIIRRSRKGVNVPTLKAKTGFDDKKVRNIIFRIAKEGRIKKAGRGVYIRA